MHVPVKLDENKAPILDVTFGVGASAHDVDAVEESHADSQVL